MDQEVFRNLFLFINKFVRFSQSEQSDIKNKVKLINLKKNEVFIDEGQIAKEIAFSIKGYLRVYYNALVVLLLILFLII